MNTLTLNAYQAPFFVIASAAKQSRPVSVALDCFAALAMTNGWAIARPPSHP
jgi:hypothetical protein